MYLLNNTLALATAFAPPQRAYVTRQNAWAEPTPFRGAATGGFAASATGVYILGYHVIIREPLQYSLLPSPTPDQIPWTLHLAAGFMATLLAVVAAALKRGFWHWVALLTALSQPNTGILMLFCASADPWALGPQTAFHAAFAHHLMASSFVIHAKSRFGRRWTSPT